MNALRAIGRFFTLGLFRFALALIVPLLILSATIGSPTFVKQVFDGSGIYKEIVPAALDETAKEAEQEEAEPGEESEDGPNILADEEIQEVVNNSLTPEIIQNNIEGVIDGAYAWLSGETEQPQITIDLTEAKTNLEGNLEQYITNRLTTLPECTTNDIPQQLNAENILDVSCVPPGIDATEQAQTFTAEFFSNADFLDELTFTAEDLPKDENDQPFWEGQFSIAPQIYQSLRAAAWVAAGVAIIFGLLLVLLHDKKRAGIRALSWSFLSVGVLWAIGAVSVWLLMNQVNDSPTIADDAMRDISNAALNIVLSRIILIGGIFGGVSTVLGIIGLVMTRTPKHNSPPESEVSEPEATEHISETATRADEQQNPIAQKHDEHTNEGKDLPQ